MVKVLDQKVSDKISLLDTFLIAGLKNVEERAMTPLVGNGTLLSGGVKTGIGILLNSMGGKGMIGKGVNLLGTATVIDGAEDLVNFIMPAGSIRSLRTQPQSSNSPTRRVL